MKDKIESKRGTFSFVSDADFVEPIFFECRVRTFLSTIFNVPPHVHEDIYNNLTYKVCFLKLNSNYIAILANIFFFLTR